MLTDEQKSCLKELLSLLSNEDLRSVATTVTRNNLVIHTSAEALEAIFLHSESADWVLNRQKVTRAVLFQYLHQKRVEFPATADKASLIKLTLTLWESYRNRTSFEPTRSETVAAQVPNEAQLIATNFAQWFYALTPEEMIPEHFWPNSRARVTFATISASNEGLGASEAALLFQNLTVHKRLQLNPNVSDDGVRGARNCHGLLVVAVCGTVHNEGICAGVFEQAFGLIQDPSLENRWKIQWTELRLTETSVHKIPSIADSPELLAICK